MSSLGSPYVYDSYYFWDDDNPYLVLEFRSSIVVSHGIARTCMLVHD